MFSRVPFYPILFSIFPVLSLAAHNIHEIALGVVFRPLLVSLILGIVLYFVLGLIFRYGHRSGMAALIIIFLFFFYGHVYNLLEDVVFQKISIFRHRTLLPLFGLLTAFLFYFVVQRVSRPEIVTCWLNLGSIFLLIYPTYGIASFTIRQRLTNRTRLELPQDVVEAEGKPDVYYVILDTYGREDVLRNLLGYDNEEFIGALRTRGFYIADCSQSNYAYTNFSLPSSLNYEYLDTLDAVHDRNTRFALIKHSAVRSFFEARGYEVVALATGWAYTEWTDADLYIEPQRPGASPNEFEDLFLSTTVLRVVSDYQLLAQDDSQWDLRRLRVLSLLAGPKRLPYRDGRQFVFAHIVVPHFPYTFGPNGEVSDYENRDLTDREARSAYVNQAQFINREILDVIDVLMEKSNPPPIILLQADHGPLHDLTEMPTMRMPILNAYYLPGIQVEDVLYPSISPVNSFRVVFNSFFDQDFPLLEDKSFYSPSENRADLQLIPNICSGAR